MADTGRQWSGVVVLPSRGRAGNRDNGYQANYDTGNGKPDFGYEKTDDI